jgi:hypothetical protein
MKKLRIKDWSDFQAYKDGRPMLWIKLWNKLLRSRKFTRDLTEIEQGQLMKLWLFASEKKNEMDYDVDWLRDEIKTKKPLDIEKFISLDYIECYDNGDPDVQIRTDSYGFSPEKSRVEKSRVEKSITPTGFISYWNKHKSLPGIKVFTDSRKRALTTRSKEPAFLDNWKLIVDKLAASKFHTGTNDRGWKATVDWILKPGNYAKILELQDSDKNADKNCSERIIVNGQYRRCLGKVVYEGEDGTGQKYYKCKEHEPKGV